MVLSQDKHGDGMFSKSIKIKTKGSGFYQTPQEIKSNVGTAYPPSNASPKNVSVHYNGESYIVTWESPDFKGDEVKLYIVKWSKGSFDELTGSVETTDLFYNSKLMLRTR